MYGGAGSYRDINPFDSRGVWGAIAILLILSLAGCARHVVHEVAGVERQRQNNPGVTVTNDTMSLRQVPRGFEPEQEWRLRPPLGESFENALENYVHRASVRIIDAEIAPNTLLSTQTVRTSMLVEANGRTYRLQYRWETDDAGWGGKWVDLIPEFIDKLAKELADRLQEDQ
jgi:hypothetical protein